MLRKFAAICFPCTQCCDNQNLQLSTMGADESKPSGVSRRELNDALVRERSRTEARLRQELLATPPRETAVTAPVVTREELEKILEKERILTAHKVRQELSVQQPIRQPFVNASAPPPPAQPSTAGYNVYPQLHDNNHRPVVEVPHQQTSAPSFVRANPSAPVLQNNVRPKERTGRPFRFDGNIDKDVQCPTCASIYGLNIYHCMQGHSACEECKEGNSKCGLCRNAITSVRNYSLEEYISNKKIPCPNEGEGCCLTIKFPELEAHLKACPFKELICPLHPIFGNCTWKGKLSKLSEHFKIVHPDNCGAVNEEMELKNLTSYSRKVFLATSGSYNFIVHIEVIPNDQKVYMTTQLCGTHNAASKWDYELHLYKKSEPRRKYMYTDVCNPHSTQVAEIFSSNKCVILPSVYFMNFINSGTINYKFYLKKKIDTNENNSNEEKNVKPRNNRNRSYGRNKNRITS